MKKIWKSRGVEIPLEYVGRDSGGWSVGRGGPIEGVVRRWGSTVIQPDLIKDIHYAIHLCRDELLGAGTPSFWWFFLHMLSRYKKMALKSGNICLHPEITAFWDSEITVCGQAFCSEIISWSPYIVYNPWWESIVSRKRSFIIPYIRVNSYSPLIQIWLHFIEIPSDIG